MQDSFQAVFAGDEEAVGKLRLDPREEVYEAAVAYCASAVAAERAGGLSVLSQWGGDQQRHLAERVSLAVIGLNDPELPVVRAAAWVLAHSCGEQAENQANSALIGLLGHDDSEVRWAVAFGMGGLEYPDALEALMELMGDTDDEVRDWATFALGTLCKADSPVIRDALRARLADPFENAREEALWGLANRRDRECLEVLAGRFERDEWVSGDRDAAEEPLGMDDLAVGEAARRLRGLVEAVRL